MVKCGECEYWEPLKDNPGMGVCRRNAPLPVNSKGNPMITAESYRAVWLHTRAFDFCGQGVKARSTPQVDEQAQSVVPSTGGPQNPFNKAVTEARKGIKRG